MTRSEVRFGHIPPEMWGYPDWIDQKKAAADRKKMTEAGVIYGWSESYRHMCRFQSGFFWRHNLTMDLDYYWRVEPGIKLFCDLDYDPFVFMQLNDKKYGFTISLHEYPATIPTLWDETKAFMKKHPDYLAKDHALHFMTDEPEKLLEPGYNMCHFWSNFEIADLRFWRDQPYTEYFEHLDKTGGFFYERWGDAPVHSIAAVLFLNRSQIHHFNDVGYYHGPWTHCPKNRALFHDNGKCLCNPEDVRPVTYPVARLRSVHVHERVVAHLHRGRSQQAVANSHVHVEPTMLEHTAGAIALLRAVSTWRPVGRDRHFNMISIIHALHTAHAAMDGAEATDAPSARDVWAKLSELYDLDGFNELVRTPANSRTRQATKKIRPTGHRPTCRTPKIHRRRTGHARAWSRRPRTTCLPCSRKRLTSQ